jgi:Cu(I)/Ag(I) efflux system protein CusF
MEITMKLTKAALIAVVAMTSALVMNGAASAQSVNGEVRKIDEAASKITLKHGPIKALDMTDESMTMVFTVQDAAMLKQVKVGDKVKFDADRVNGKITVTKIEKTK